MIEKHLTKQRIAVLVILAVLILFRGKFEELTNALLVVPFFSKCASDWLSNVIFLGIGVAVGYVYIGRLRRDYLSSLDSLGLAVAITSIYAYYRLINQTWEFIGIYELSSVKYADVVYLWLLGELLIVMKRRLKTKAQEEARPLAFALDEPIQGLEDDELDRKHEAELLAKRVRQTQGKYSFSVAINGAWGTGKTSFMNLVKRFLKADDVIIMDFNPWLGQESNLITKDFFESLRFKLKPYSSQIDGELEAYSNQFVEVEDGWISKSVKSLFSLVSSNSLKEQFDRVNDTLEKLDKQVVVFIDDLDRLSDSEIQSVLRLIRNTADFRNVKYVVAFDRAYVEKAIKSINGTNHTSYLEKIFLYPLLLPPVRSSYILKGLTGDLIKRFHNQEAEIIKAFTGTHKSIDEIEKFILTIRDLRRFTNQFVADYAFVETEVIFSEFLRIQLLKFKFSSVYELLAKGSNTFLEVPSSSMNWVDDKRGYELKRIPGSIDRKDYVFKQYLTGNLESLSIAATDVPIIMELVEGLFSQNRHSYGRPGEHLTIVYYTNYERYFRNRIFEYDLSNKEFTRMLTLPLVQMQGQIEKWVKDGKKLSVVRRFTDVRTEKCASRGEFEKLIKSIIYLAKCQAPIGVGYGIGYYDRDLADKFSDYKGRISKKFYGGDSEKYGQFVRGIFTEAEPPYTFESGFLKEVNRSPEDFPLAHDEMRNLLVDYLKDYLSSVTLLDKYCWDLFHKCNVSEFVERKGDVIEPKKVKNPEASKIFIDFVEEFALDQFLYMTVDINIRNEKTFAPSNVITQLFGSFEAFGVFLAAKDAESHKHLHEFMEFLEVFIKKGARDYVSFDFKVIPVHEKIQER
jgi:hypothetical protein